MLHEHQMIYVADATPECGGHRIYWCGQCGLIGELFPLKMYEMTPEWSKPKLDESNRQGETFVFLREQTTSRRRESRRLGRGLSDIKTQAANHLSKLLLGDKKNV